MIYVGIDPGKSGAIAAIEGHNVVLCEDVPTIPNGKGQEYNISAMSDLLRSIALKGEIYVAIERAQAMRKGKDKPQGVASMFNFGRGYGIWLGILGALGLPYETVRACDWTKTILKGMPGKGKARSIQYVMERFPEAELIPEKCRKPRDGRADAICLAKYAQMVVV